jgi:NitT/TauT family transport system substrate-binding protein
MPYLGFSPIFIAEEEGYFDGEGLKIEFVRMKRSSQAIPLLIKGELDVVAGTNSFSLYNAMNQGARIRIVGGRGYVAPGSCVGTAIMVNSSLNLSPEKLSADDLRGLRSAINPMSSNAFFFQRFLDKYGLSMEDMEIADISNSLKIEAFSNRAIDLAHASEPWITRIQRFGSSKVLASAGDLIPGYQKGLIVFGPSLLDDKPELGTKFMRAYLKGVAALEKGKTDRIIEILSKHTRLEADLLKEACWPSFRADGSVSIGSILEFQEWGVTRKALDRIIPAGEFYDPRFVKGAVRP